MQIKIGSQDVSIPIKIIDSTTGAAETGVTSATAGLDLKYLRQGETVVSLTEDDLAAIDSAHADGKMFEIGNGNYRLDPPDAAFLTGADWVLFFGTATGMTMVEVLVELVAYDPQDATDLGLTNLDATVSSRSSHTAANVVDEFETQSQADPTGFHVNVKEVNGTAQTANDNGADINAILEDSGTTIPNQITGLNNLSTSDILGMTVDNDGSAVSLNAFYRLVLAALTGKTAGSGTSTITFYGVDGTTPRLVMTVSPVGNRTTITTRDGS